jgi:hypothetical protein
MWIPFIIPEGVGFNGLSVSFVISNARPENEMRAHSAFPFRANHSHTTEKYAGTRDSRASEVNSPIEMMWLFGTELR